MALTADPTDTAHLGDSGTLRHVGKRRMRSDAPPRLTGQLRYTDDLALPGVLHARFVRSPYASARVVSVDPSAALHVPGVVRVLTARDLPVPNLAEAMEKGSIFLADRQVRHAGQPVAVVLADSGAAAEDGAAAVEVVYEPLPVVVDPVAAMAPDAPVVREQTERDDAELAEHGAAPQLANEVTAPQAPNVGSTTRLHRGDVARGFAEADVVVEREYRTAWVHQGYIEPQVCAAHVDALGNVVVYACTQALFHARTEVASTLGVPLHQVRVEPMPVGGGFGGKFGFLEPLTAAIAKAVDRPVRLTFTRMDDFAMAVPAPQSVIRVKVGARKDGTLTTLQANLVYDSGCRPGAPVGISALLLGSTYRWEHVLIEGAEVMTHKPSSGAYRAPGAPQASFTIESTVDEVAYALGIDPLELRRKNAVRTGDKRADNVPWNRIGLQECLEHAAPIYEREMRAAAQQSGQGVGIGIGAWPGGLESAAAACRLNPDGTLQITLGAIDLTGAHTSFEAIAAEAFGLEDASKVQVRTANTDAAPHAGASGGSKITYTVGPAVAQAAREARQQVLRIAAAEMEASIEDLELVNGEIRVKGVPGKVRTLADICRLSATFGAKYEPVQGQGRTVVTKNSPGMAVHISRVQVDPDTGRVTPLRTIVVQDVGKAINPALVEGQMLGGAVQGVGWGLYEQMAYDESGNPLNTSFMDYVLPRATQSPELEAVLVEVPSEWGPYGAKGVGEPPVVPGAAALANAVRAATGARVTTLPITPERVREALAAL